jgi:hypothetical protein
MSLRYEQCYALYKTRNFLRDLLDSSARPKTVKELKARAYSCLRHFPFLDERGAPIFSRDDFECPVIKPIDAESIKFQVLQTIEKPHEENKAQAIN